MPSLTSMAPLLRLLEWKKMGVFSCAVDIPPLIHFCCFVFILTGRQREKKLRPEKLFTFFLTCVCVWPLCENREDINFPDRKPPIAGGKGSPLFFSSNPSTKSFFYNISTYCFLLYKYLSETAHMRTEWRISSLQISIVHPPLHLLYIIYPSAKVVFNSNHLFLLHQTLICV